MPKLTATRWVRIGAFVFVALATAATAVEMRREGREGAVRIVTRHADDPLSPELERCKTITPEMGLDTACERAWTENRRRFFAVPAKAPASPTADPVESVSPTVGSAPAARRSPDPVSHSSTEER